MSQQGRKFLQRLIRSAEAKNSRIVLALDLLGQGRLELRDSAISLIRELGKDLAAVKVNFHLLLPLSILSDVKKICVEAHKMELQVIADLKLNDIASTNLLTTSYLWRAGFDAVIVNPIAGYEDGLEPLLEDARIQEKGVIVLGYMSHSGAQDTYGLSVNSPLHDRVSTLSELFVSRALDWGADGLVIGATYPKTIKKTRQLVGDRLPIFSPGIATQGGDPKAAIKAGTDFLIVGRGILEAKDPSRTLSSLRKKTWPPKIRVIQE